MIKNHKIKVKVSWFWLAIITLFLSSLALRFWNLGQFDKLVFDEIYYVKYAKNYLNHLPFFDVHPPLGKYLIALGLWINTLPFWHREGQLTAFGYRWFNALTGSFVPLIVAGIAYQLSYRRSYAFIAGLFAAADGLLLVESRYALLNVYLIFFGLLAQWTFLVALSNKNILRQLYLILSGIFLGSSAAVKWYGLGFWLGIVLLLVSAWLINLWQFFQEKSLEFQIENRRFFWQNLTQINVFSLLFSLGIIPIIVYCLLWIPHLQLSPERGFWQLHEQSLTFHQQLDNSSDVHPYCSPWYSWVLMIRPVAYFYEKSRDSTQTIVRDVHGMGNPILWWLVAISILTLIITWLKQLKARKVNNFNFWIPLYLLLNYGANWLPWAMVHRCAFIYYYMSASIFGFLAIAYLVERWLSDKNLWWRAMGVNIIFLILMGFTYWLPIYLGLPLSDREFRLRMWLSSWY
jgi:dolichyl-phosphate-mannose--protein O-mannosyl transferase